MTRTRKEIAQAIKTEFIDNGTIQEAYRLENGKGFDEQFSKVSIEWVLIDIFASAAWLLEELWSLFATETEKRIDDACVTSLPWYYQKALEFQRGAELEFDNRTYSYRYKSVDEKAMVIKHVAIREVKEDNVSKLKVYYSDAQKNALDNATREAFERYMKEIGAAGTHYVFVSAAPDELRVHLRVYYDALVLDSSGKRLDTGVKPVEKAVESYLNNLEYGGVFYQSKVLDIIKQAEGVKDVVLDGTTWKGTKEQRRRIESESGAFAYIKNDADIIYTVE